MLTAFEVLAQPIRRSMLDRLRRGEQLVGGLAEALRLTQPPTSKHLPGSTPYEWAKRQAAKAGIGFEALGQRVRGLR